MAVVVDVRGDQIFLADSEGESARTDERPRKTLKPVRGQTRTRHLNGQRDNRARTGSETLENREREIGRQVYRGHHQPLAKDLAD